MSNKKHNNTDYQNNNSVDETISETIEQIESNEVITEPIITTDSNEILNENIIDNILSCTKTDLKEYGVSELIEEVHAVDEKIIPINDIKEETQIVDTDTVKNIVNERKPIVDFYKVGTEVIRNKCKNQVISTTDLELAKSKCINARNTCMKTYHVFDKDGNAVYTAEYNIPKDNYYRVGTDFKNGKCINQKYYTVNLDEACKKSDENTKLTGVIHNVYDPTGKTVFSSKKKLTLLSNKKRKVIEHADWYAK